MRFHFGDCDGDYWYARCDAAESVMHALQEKLTNRSAEVYQRDNQIAEQKRAIENLNAGYLRLQSERAELVEDALAAAEDYQSLAGDLIEMNGLVDEAEEEYERLEEDLKQARNNTQYWISGWDQKVKELEILRAAYVELVAAVRGALRDGYISNIYTQSDLLKLVGSTDPEAMRGSIIVTSSEYGRGD